MIFSSFCKIINHTFWYINFWAIMLLKTLGTQWLLQWSTFKLIWSNPVGYLYCKIMKKLHCFYITIKFQKVYSHKIIISSLISLTRRLPVLSLYLYYYQGLNSRHIWNLEEEEFWGQKWTNPDHWHNSKPQGLVLQECLQLSLFDQDHCKHLWGKTLLVTAIINKTKWPYSQNSFILLLGSL